MNRGIFEIFQERCYSRKYFSRFRKGNFAVMSSLFKHARISSEGCLTYKIKGVVISFCLAVEGKIC